MVTSECSIGSQGHQGFCLPCGTQQSVRVCVPWCPAGGYSLIWWPVFQCHENRTIWTGNSCGLSYYGYGTTLWDNCASHQRVEVKFQTKKGWARRLIASFVAPSFQYSFLLRSLILSFQIFLTLFLQHPFSPSYLSLSVPSILLLKLF